MTTAPKPHIDDAPGLIWRKMSDKWEARWQARTDLAQKGFEPKSVRLWTGTAPTPEDAAYISDRCRHYQSLMLVFSAGGIPLGTGFDGSLRSLIACYQSDPDSRYRQLRYKTRVNYDAMALRLDRERGETMVADIDARMLLRWHEAWTAGGKVAMGHSLIGLLRTLLTFGSTLLKNRDCKEAKGLLHDMRFKMPKARESEITAEQATTVRGMAREVGWYSIALAQAFQFELMLRQKDVIGEWVPRTEPGPSDVFVANRKWMRGIVWQRIDADMTLRHLTSKTQKKYKVNLTLAPMIMDELRYVAQFQAWRAAGMPDTLPPLPDVVTRDMLPASGPLVICETTARPWTDHEFRRKWRGVARAAGVPDHVYNMDSRAGGATEATDSGADLEDVRHGMTHSQISMTARYSRGSEKKIAKVLKLRAAHRGKVSNGSET